MQGSARCTNRGKAASSDDNLRGFYSPQPHYHTTTPLQPQPFDKEVSQFVLSKPTSVLLFFSLTIPIHLGLAFKEVPRR